VSDALMDDDGDDRMVIWHSYGSYTMKQKVRIVNEAHGMTQ